MRCSTGVTDWCADHKKFPSDCKVNVERELFISEYFLIVTFHLFFFRFFTSLTCMCKRGFGSPRIWIPHPKTLADLDDPKRGFGSPADLDPSIYFVYDRLENDDVECWEPNPRTPKHGFGSPADLDPDSQRIVEDLFRQVSMSLAHSD